MAKKKGKKHEEDRYYYAFPVRLRYLLESHGISQQILAEHLGITRQMVGKYGDGFSSPDWERLVKIADFFDVSTDFLLGRSDVESKSELVQLLYSATGLSGFALHRLIEEKDEDRLDLTKFVSFLITQPEIHQMIDSIKIRNHFADSGKICLIGESETTFGVEIEDICDFEANRIFREIMNRYKPQEQEVEKRHPLENEEKLIKSEYQPDTTFTADKLQEPKHGDQKRDGQRNGHKKN